MNKIISFFLIFFMSLLTTNCSGDDKVQDEESYDNTTKQDTLKTDDSYKAIATIYPKRIYGRTIDHFFLDLKGWENIASNQDKANLFFQDLDMDGIRINIHGENIKPAHPAKGVVDSIYYATMLQSIRVAKLARGDKPFYIFASKKSSGKSWPNWVYAGDTLNPSKYSDMVIDYLKFLKNHDITVDYLGIANEMNNITPDIYAQTVIALKDKCLENDIKIPKMIGPDKWEPIGNKPSCWIKNFLDKGYGDQLDIYGTHYYPNHRYYDKVTYELSLIGDRDFWATEPHWTGIESGTDYLNAEKSVCALWDLTDNGMNAFMWWGYGVSFHQSQYICQEFSAPIHGAQPCKMEDFDGESTTTYGKFQTRSFIKGNNLEVYIINNNTRVINNAPFKIDSANISGDVIATQFIENGPVSGDKNTVKPVTNNVFLYTIPAKSFIHFSVPLDLK